MTIIFSKRLIPSFCHVIGGLLILFIVATSACKVKEGCPTKNYTNSMEKTTKHGKSNLFDKKMRKKMKG